MYPNELKELTIKARQVQWQYKLEEYTEAELKKLRRTVKKTRNGLEDYLISNRGGKVGRGRKQAVLQEMDDLLFGLQSKISGDIVGSAAYAGSAASYQYSNILSFDGKASMVNMVAVSPEQLKTAYRATTGGTQLNTWIKKSFDTAVETQIGRELLTGYLQGESSYNLSKRLDEAFGMIRRDAETLALTHIAEANNMAIKSVYDANADIIKEEEWSAALEVNMKNGRGTCIRCAGLDGRRYKLDTPHVRPPLHPRCRCFMLPVTVSYKELGLDISEIEEVAKAYQVKKGGKVLSIGNYAGNFGDWLRTQPKNYQLSVLGPNRLRLIEAGTINFSELVDKYGNLRLLERNAEGVYSGLLPASNVFPVILSTPPTVVVIETPMVESKAFDPLELLTPEPLPKVLPAKKKVKGKPKKVSLIAEKKAAEKEFTDYVTTTSTGIDINSANVQAFLSEESPEGIRKSLGFIKEIQESNKATSSRLEARWVSSSQSFAKGFDKKVARVVKKLENADTFWGEAKQLYKFTAQDSFESGVSSALPALSKWVGSTNYGNIKNGRMLKILGRMVDEDIPLLKHNILPAIDRASPLTYLEKFMVESKAVKQAKKSFNTLDHALDLLEFDSEKLAVMVEKNRFPSSLVSKLDMENNYYIRRSAPMSSAGINSASAVGQKVDFGFSSFGDIQQSWHGDGVFLLEIPKKEARAYFENNMAFHKLGQGSRDTADYYGLADVFPNTTEREIVLKNYYEIQTSGTEHTTIRIDVKQQWFVLRPAQ